MRVGTRVISAGVRGWVRELYLLGYEGGGYEGGGYEDYNCWDKRVITAGVRGWWVRGL